MKDSLFKTKYKKYLLSDEWATMKIDLIHIRGHKCERCPSKGNLHLHHLTYKNVFNEEPEDLELLCAKCHATEHGITKAKKPKKKKKVKNKRAFKPKKKRFMSYAALQRLEKDGHKFKRLENIK